MIEADELVKEYRVTTPRGLLKRERRVVRALDRVSLQVQRGELFGLVGPNGAGKTTFIKCLTTLLRPTSGSARVAGFDVGRQPVQVRQSMGCLLLGDRGLYGKLTGRENLLYFAATYYLPPGDARRRVDGLVERLRLAEFVDRPVSTYSAGQRMRTSFARALVNDAPLLVLDEPTNALDVHSARDLRALVRELRDEGRTILYTSHVLAEVEQLCDRVAIVNQGRIIAMGTVDELKTMVPEGGALRVRGEIPEETVADVAKLDRVHDVALSEVDGADVLAVTTAQPLLVLPDLVRLLYARGARIDDILPSQVTLEDVFVTVTAREPAGAEEAKEPGR